MNIEYMRQVQFRPEEGLPVRREFTFFGQRGCLLGFTRAGEELKAHFLVNDASPEEDMVGRTVPRRTNRAVASPNPQDSRPRFMSALKGIRYQGLELKCRSGSGGSPGPEHGEQERNILRYFLYCDVDCGHLEEYDLSRLTLYTWTFAGAYATLPFRPEEGGDPELLWSDSVSVRVPVKKRIRLRVGDCGGRKYSFQCPDGQERFFYLDNVSLYDPWKDARERFKDPRYLETATPEQIAESQKNLMETLGHSNCPEGKCYVSVEYEIAEGNLQLEASAFLKGKEALHGCSSGVLYIVKPDKKTGRHGLPMRGDILKYPVDPALAYLDAEIVSAWVPLAVDLSEPEEPRQPTQEELDAVSLKYNLILPERS